jgi:predicted transcriptional regulator
MQRGLYDITAEILGEVIRSPNLAPTRLMSRTSVSYIMLTPLLSAGLVKAEFTSKRRRKLTVTEKGREFLQHYKALTEIFPRT